MNRFNVDHAAPGFCSLCHDEIAEFDGFYDFGNTKRPKVTFLKPNFRQAMVKLSDGTSMNVSLCDKCINFPPEDADKLYQSELRGWHREVDAFEGKMENLHLMRTFVKTQEKHSIIDREDIKWTDSDRAKISKENK